MSEYSAKSALPKPGTRVLVYGHRGAMAYRPQNTMPSFELAWEQGAHGIELDAQCTADGVPVVFHDETLDALTDGSGPVRAHDLADILRLDAGYRFDPAYAGVRIPLLETVLRARPAGTFVNIELKTDMGLVPHWWRLVRPFVGYPALTDGAEPEREREARRLSRIVADCVRSVAAADSDLMPHLLVSSFDPCALRAFREELPDVPQGFLFYQGIRLDTRPLMRGIPHEGWHPQLLEVPARAIRKEHAAGRFVNVWTVNRESTARRLVRVGVDGLITNRPDAMLPLV
jgi:glycerophosphoryl diester phosphodiesterase